MYENANGIMVPDNTVLRELYHAFHYGEPVSASKLFDDSDPLDPAPYLEPIDDDPIINALLAAENL